LFLCSIYRCPTSWQPWNCNWWPKVNFSPTTCKECFLRIRIICFFNCWIIKLVQELNCLCFRLLFTLWAYVAYTCSHPNCLLLSLSP
jgi:hypothetical protein